MSTSTSPIPIVEESPAVVPLEPVREESAQTLEPPLGTRTFKIAETVLLAIAAVLYALHFVHLRADFPNYSPWPDWAKYTDEGWYGLAAIRHYQLGHWNVPGDFNPAAALPVWPLLELAVFHFTGVSLVAARALTIAIFGLILLCCWLLLRGWAADQGESRSLAPAIAVLLLAASPFFFAFSRLAILEPLMILLALAGLMLAQRAGASSTAAWSIHASGRAAVREGRASLRAFAWSAGLGLVVVAMVLTKTTGLFLVPAIAWMLWASCAHRVRTMLRASGVAAIAAAAAWGGYMLLFVRPRYMEDYRYLFSANGYTGITKATFWPVVQQMLLSVGFVGTAILWMGLAAVIAAIATIVARRFRRDALTVSLLIWLFFYVAFLAYHDNLSPRYYQAVGVPLVLLIAMMFDRLWQSAMHRGSGILPWLACSVAGAAVVFTAARGAAQEIRYVRHPQYTFLSAVNQIHAAIERQRAEDRIQNAPVHPEMVLSISGAEMQLIDGLPSICDDFGTMTLPDRIAAYPPGWFVTWNDVEDDKMEALAPVYRLVRVGAWPAFDDPERNLLILYRLDPLASSGKGKAQRRRSVKVPRRLETRIGEQPTAKQLEH